MYLGRWDTGVSTPLSPACAPLWAEFSGIHPAQRKDLEMQTPEGAHNAADHAAAISRPGHRPGPPVSIWSLFHGAWQPQVTTYNTNHRDQHQQEQVAEQKSVLGWGEETSGTSSLVSSERERTCSKWLL